MQNNTAPNTRRLEGRVALVTGASRGIGAAVAEGLAREGAQVVLLARTIGALEALDDKIQAIGGRATLLPFDLGETKKIQAIGPTLAERFGRLDILVGNAAMLGTLGPAAQSDDKIWEETFRVNFWANYQLTRTLDPLLRGSDAGRALFVTTRLTAAPRPFWGAYTASKAALEGFARTYAAEVSYSPLKVNVIDPGSVRTELRAEAMPNEDTSKLQSPEDVVPRFIDLLLPQTSDTGQLFKPAA